MRTRAIQLQIDPVITREQFSELWHAAWGDGEFTGKLSHSLGYIGAYDGTRLIGFVNVAWDGGMHAFVLDTCVHPNYRRQGIATELVNRAAQVARARGAEWLHVDFEPHLTELYRRCGFRHTAAGILAL